MPQVEIQLVIFDIGRVLIQLVDGWEDACHKADVPVPSSLRDPTVQSNILEIGLAHERGEIDEPTFATETASHCGLNADQVMRISNHWLQGTFPGTHELVADLAAQGIEMACLSNTNNNHWQIMHGDNHNALPFERFAHKFASHLIGVMKPDDGIYEYVEQITSLPPQAIAFFDDAPPNVAKARQRGWHAHLITRDRLPADQMREHLATHRVLS